MKAWNCVAIVGVGLIGGSVGLALRSRGMAIKVVGFGSRRATLETANKLGAITEIAADLNGAVAEAELVVVCAPVADIVEQVRQAARFCRPGTLITDVGSTKAEIVAELEKAAEEPAWGREVHFLGSHPLAGNERKGPQHASADLFARRIVVITPTPRTRNEDRSALAEFWAGLGANVVPMSADEHDRALAATSHLPHLVAAAIAGATPERYVTLTAGGWQDTTRIAAGDPLLWRQIMLANRTNLLASLDRFATLLADWRAALDAGDAVELERLLTEAKRIRDAVGS
ncbi:MAG: prephenate dehydrogenase [Planctomycetia bacterium]|nr:prephenate dehydrogenase [Planctomycetia bacterium]